MGAAKAEVKMEAAKEPRRARVVNARIFVREWVGWKKGKDCKGGRKRELRLKRRRDGRMESQTRLCEGFYTSREYA